MSALISSSTTTTTILMSALFDCLPKRAISYVRCKIAAFQKTYCGTLWWI